MVIRMVKKYSTLFELNSNLEARVLCLIPNKEFKNQWNQLVNNWNIVKKNYYLPSRSLSIALSWITNSTIRIRWHTRFFDNISDDYVWIVADNLNFSKEKIRDALTIWETTLTQQGVKAVNIDDFVDSIKIEEKIINYNSFMESPSKGLIPKTWIYDALPLWIAGKLKENPIILGSQEQYQLRSIIDGNLAIWDSFIKYEAKKKTYRGMYQFAINLLNYPGIKKIFFAIDTYISRFFVNPEKTKLYEKKTVFVDLNRLMNINSENPILKLNLSARGTPHWEYLEGEVLNNITSGQFPKISSIFPVNSFHTDIRSIHSSRDGYHGLGKGAGVLSHANAMIHVEKCIKHAKHLKFSRIKGGIYSRKNISTGYNYSKDNLEKIINEKELGKINLFLIFQDNPDSYVKLYHIIQDFGNKFNVKLSSQINSINNIIKNRKIEIGPFQVNFIKFPRDSDLFKTKYRGTIEEALQEIEQYLPDKLITPNLRNIALIETNWKRRVPKYKINAKLLMREVCAKKGLANQFLDVQNELNENIKKHIILELYRLAGLSFLNLNISGFSSDTWFIGIYIKSSKNKKWTGAMVAMKNQSSEMKACHLFGGWKDLHNAIVDVQREPFQSRQKEVVKEEIINRLKDLAIKEKDANNRLNAVIFINAQPTRQVWEGLKSNKLKFDNDKIFGSPLLNKCALIRVCRERREIPRIFHLKTKEEGKDRFYSKDTINLENYYELLEIGNVRASLGGTMVLFDKDENGLLNERFAFYERREPVGMRKVRQSGETSKYSYPKKEWQTTLPTEIIIINKGLWSCTQLLKSYGHLTRVSPFWKNPYAHPLPLHLAFVMVKDKIGKI